MTVIHNYAAKIFKIYQGEGNKVLTFAAVGILHQIGISIMYMAADALFLSHIGANKLPYIYFILPAFTLCITPVISYVTEKLGANHFQIIANFMLAAGGILIFVCMEAIRSENIQWLYYGIKLYASLWLIIGFTVYWNFVDTYFDILSAKRLFPLLSGSTAFGSTIGGYLVTVFMDSQLSVDMLFLVGSATALLATLPVWKINRSFTQIYEYEKEDLSFLEQMQCLGKTYKTSKYVLYLTLATFFSIFISNYCEFQYMKIFGARYTNETELANLFGSLFMFVNIFNALMTFFVFNRLITFLGVRNTALIQPTMYILFFTLYMVLMGQHESMLYAAMFGFFVHQGIQLAVDENNWNLILNPIPQTMKSPVRVFVEGIVDPIGGALAGLSLLVMNQVFQWSALQIATIGLGLAGYYFLMALLVRHRYVNTMIENLRSEWLDFSQTESDIFGNLRDKHIEELLRFGRSGDIQNSLTACRILWVNDRTAATKLLLEILMRCEPQHQNRVLEDLVEMLAVRDNAVIHIVIEWLLTHYKEMDSTLIQEFGRFHLIPVEIMLNMLDSVDPDARGAATTALWNSWDIEKVYQAILSVRSLLQGNEKERAAGILSIGNTGRSHYAGYLVPYLDDPSPNVSKCAKQLISRLVDIESSRLLEKFLEMVEQEDPEIRSIGLQALARIGDSQCIPPLLSMVDSFSPYERRQVSQMIIGIGLRSVPAAVRVVQDAGYPYRGRSIAARTIAKLTFPQLQSLMPSLIAQELLRAYQILYYQTVLDEAQEDSSGTRVLSRFYRDEQSSTIEFILEILALSGQLPSNEMIASSLQSKSAKTRGDAIETLEQAVNRQVFKQLLPLVDGRSTVEKIRFYFDNFHAKPLLPEHIVNLAWESNVDLERSASVQAMWDWTQTGKGNGKTGIPVPCSSSALFEQISQKFGDAPPRLKDTVFSLLFREGGRLNQDTIIERISLFAAADLFGSIRTQDLAVLAEGAQYVQFPQGAPIYSENAQSDSLYVIKTGEVHIRWDSQFEKRSPGQTCGEEMLLGNRKRNHSAEAGPMAGYRVTRDFLQNCIQNHPRTAISLLEKIRESV